MPVPIYFYLNVIAILVWLIYERRRVVDLALIGYYVTFCFIAEVAAWLYSYFLYTSNHWLYNVFTTLQLLFLSDIYRRQLTSLRTERITFAFIISYPLMVILNLMLFQSFLKFHTYTYILGSLFVIFLIYAYYDQLLHSREVRPLKKNAYFWFNLGNTIYFTGSIFYMGSINFILENDHDGMGELISVFVYSFTSIQYVCFIIAFVCDLKQRAN